MKKSKMEYSMHRYYDKEMGREVIEIWKKAGTRRRYHSWLFLHIEMLKGSLQKAEELR